MKLLAAAIAAILFLPSPAAAKVKCGPRAAIAEYPVSTGLLKNGNMIEVFVLKTGAFAIIMTRPDGLACLMEAGKNWEDLPGRKKDIGI